MTRRTDRLNALLRQEISDLLIDGVKDPRLAGLVSVTEVQVSADLAHARVFVSVLGTEEDERSAITALHSAAPFLRRELLHRLDLKRVPELSFRSDPSIRRGDELSRLISGLTRGDS